MHEHFSGKCNSIQIPINSVTYLPIKLNDNPVQLCELQKHLSVILDKYLNLHKNIEKKNKIYNKLIDTLICSPSEKIFANNLFYHNLILVICDNSINKSLINKLKKIKY